MAADYVKVRAQHAGKKGPTLVTLVEARANAFKADWKHYTPPVPTFIGRREFRNVDLAELAKFIDWGPFFQAWELRPVSRYPGGSGGRRGGAQRPCRGARDAGRKIIEGRWLTANGGIGLFPAASVNRR